MPNQNSLKTKCNNGHFFDSIDSKGNRVCTLCVRNYNKKYRENNRDYIKKYKREHPCPPNDPQYMREHNLKSHGWSVSLFSRTMHKQHGKCAICKKKLNTKNKRGKNGACADHIHTSPPVPRGILCRQCNAALGLLQDSVVIIKAAAAYVSKFAQN